MSNFSLTYKGIAILIISNAFEFAGVPFVEGDFETTLVFVGNVIGVVTTLWGRFRLGDLTPWGKRKPTTAAPTEAE